MPYRESSQFCGTSTHLLSPALWYVPWALVNTGEWGHRKLVLMAAHRRDRDTAHTTTKGRRKIRS